MKKNENSTFKMVAQLFLAFNNESELTQQQLNTMGVAMNMLNAIDVDGKLNGGDDYTIVEQSDNPIWVNELPEVPANPLPKVEDKYETLAEISMGDYNIGILKDKVVFTAANDNLLGGELNFKDGIPMYSKLEWCERNLLKTI